MVRYKLAPGRLLRLKSSNWRMLRCGFTALTGGSQRYPMGLSGRRRHIRYISRTPTPRHRTNVDFTYLRNLPPVGRGNASPSSDAIHERVGLVIQWSQCLTLQSRQRPSGLPPEGWRADVRRHCEAASFSPLPTAGACAMCGLCTRVYPDWKGLEVPASSQPLLRRKGGSRSRLSTVSSRNGLLMSIDSVWEAARTFPGSSWSRSSSVWSGGSPPWRPRTPT